MGLKIFINTERKVSKKQEKDSFSHPDALWCVCQYFHTGLTAKLEPASTSPSYQAE